MVNRRFLKVFLLLPFLLVPASFVFGQEETFPAETPVAPVDGTSPESESSALPEEEEKNYSLHTDETGDTYFIQKFSWPEIPYAKMYYIAFEKKDENGDFQPLGEVLETAENSIEVSFSPGIYRYLVKVVNLLGKVQVLSEFQEFKIRQAFQPELHSVSPNVIYLEYPQTGVFSLTGINFFEESSIFLGTNSTQITPSDISLDNEDGTSATVTFPVSSLNPGEYQMQVVDPSGLSASLPVSISYMKPFEYLLSVSYKPVFIPHDDTFKEYLGNTFMPFGVELSGTFVFYKRAVVHFGVSTRFSYAMFSGGEEYYDASANIFQGFLNIDTIFMLFNKRLLVDLYLGPGISFLHNLHFSYSHDLVSEDFTSWSVAANAGISLMYFFTENRHLFIQGGCEAFFTFYGGDTLLLGLSPKLGVGWQF